ncbi:MAG: hypothetical protein KatS3mg050_4739 [Litorilinea sp.]|nr:MAG: hypothetical protein KatS3mg050_4739 [Litorilinea sp.]
MLTTIVARRLLDRPIITPALDESIGTNINGPSLIRVPDWLPNPLGRYYLYFAHHQGEYIRLAYADDLAGPWRIHRPGTLQLAQTPCRGHIASPDVHVDEANRRIVMYYHGPALPADVARQEAVTQRFPTLGGQRSFVATSEDGIHFTSGREILGSSYFRVFRWRDHVYALGMPGIFYRSRDGFTGFEQGPVLFDEHMRHTALLLRGDDLYVFYSRAGDCPERILAAHIHLTPDWMTWRASPPTVVLEPEREYEGGHLPLEPSRRGAIHEPARQLRDPAIFVDGERVILLYSVAGEQGIALAELQF